MTDGIEPLQVARQWVEKAEEDLTNAQHTLTLKERCPYGTICFHAQQVAEKYLKSLLIYCEIPFPRSHDLLDVAFKTDHKSS